MTPIAQLIDRERELRAALAGVQLEIAIYFGDRDGAQRARKEMEAQTVARKAAREACFFDQAGERDAMAVQGRVAA